MRYGFLAVAVAAVCLAGCARLREARGPAPARMTVSGEAQAAPTPLMVGNLETGEAVSIKLNEPDKKPVWLASATPKESSAYGRSFNAGPFLVCLVDDESAMSRDSQGWKWLLDQLAMSGQPWKVVFLPKPLFQPGPIRVDTQMFDLADLLASAKVTFAFAPGEGAFIRTAPIGSSQANSTRYILIPRQAGTRTEMPAWVSAAVYRVCTGVLDGYADRVHWRLQCPDGDVDDNLDIVPAAETKYAARIFSIGEILSSEREQNAGKEENPEP